MAAKFFSAVLIYTENLEQMASFYRDILGIPLEEEKHGNVAAHYGCELGDLHFAIHAASAGNTPGTGSVKLAFEVFDIEKHMQEMVAHNVNITAQIKDMEGFLKIAAIKDPDGNTIEFTELSKNWVEHLRSRKSEGQDIVSQWDKRHS
ncbi:MAG: VOC family protein [Bdellovibrionales bacterium]